MNPGSNFEILVPTQDKIMQLVSELSISPLLARLLINRGIREISDAKLFLNGTLDDMYDPMGMGDMPRAIDIIMEHLNKGDKILIHGDYDADGVTSTAIMIKALSRLGGTIEYYIPDRFDEGYGFSEDAVRAATTLGVKLIITVDCGTSNHEIVTLAHKEGIRVIITDHHEVSHGSPPADAFVNLKKPGETYPFRELSGAGVAFKVIQGIYQKLGRSDWKDFVDLAAVGTIADVVPLRGENRLIAREGLEKLATRTHPGITQLLEITNVTRKALSPWDISFIIAPKINAAGRLDDATVALKFLMENDVEKARELALKLCKMNEQRQQVENTIKEEIERMINEDPNMLAQPVWVLGSRNWHQGVIGIVASRFSQSHKRPVYLISIDAAGVGRGSARSEDNYDVYKALTSAHDILVHFGGHRLAGGFNIPESNIPILKERVSNPIFFSPGRRPIQVDAELEQSQISLETARILEALAPFGEGNPKPLFLSRNMKIQSIALVGNQEQHLKVWVSTPTGDVKGIAFNKGNTKGNILQNQLYYDMLFNLDVDTWNNTEEPSLKIQEIIPPDKECMRIVSGLEEVAIKCDEPDNCDDNFMSWVTVDSRRVINRRRYIKNLNDFKKRSLILTRNRRQMEVLTENLKQEGVHNIELLNNNKTPSKVKDPFISISPYEYFRGNSEVSSYQEVVLYHPPFLWDHFYPGIFKSDSLKRVHLLFTEADIKREETNQEILAPDRRRLLKIYNQIKKLSGTPGEPFRIQPAQLVLSINNDKIHVITIQIALKIFNEIGLLDYTEDEQGILIKLMRTQKKELEESTTFHNQMQKKMVFYQLKDLYMKPFLHEFTLNLKDVLQSQK
jgi:single-stranded-DNA-specific exonuclease